MNDHLIVTIYVVTDDLLKASCHTSHPLASVSDAEILTVAIVAAAYFHNHHERALWAYTVWAICRHRSAPPVSIVGCINSLIGSRRSCR